MKKAALASFIFSLLSFYSICQITDTGDEVGIGTISPAEKLEVLGNISATGLRSVLINPTSGAIDVFGPTTGGWATGLRFRNSSGNDVGGWRAYGSDNNLNYLYAGNAYQSPWLAIKPDGNVGIGTVTPSSKLEVNGKLTVRVAILAGQNFVSSIAALQVAGFQRTGSVYLHEGQASTTLSENYAILSNNEDVLKWDGAGISGKAIEAINHLSGEIGTYNINTLLKLENNSNAYIECKTPTTAYAGLLFTDNSSQIGGIAYAHNGTIENNTLGIAAYRCISFRIGNSESGIFEKPEKMRIDDQGNVGIGTTNTFGYKLAVNGTIGAKEIEVEVDNAWPDYVFSSDYSLRSIPDLKYFIKK